MVKPSHTSPCDCEMKQMTNFFYLEGGWGVGRGKVCQHQEIKRKQNDDHRFLFLQQRSQTKHSASKHKKIVFLVSYCCCRHVKHLYFNEFPWTKVNSWISFHLFLIKFSFQALLSFSNIQFQCKHALDYYIWFRSHMWNLAQMNRTSWNVWQWKESFERLCTKQQT